MRNYIIKRTIISVITIWIIITASFFLLKSLPGDPFGLMTEDQRQKIYAYYGLDKSLIQQYFTYLGNLLHGNLGYSIQHKGTSVNSIIADTFPVSAALGLMSYIISLPLGILMGVISAKKKGKFIDYAMVVFSVLGVCVPVFVLACLLQWVFGFKYRIFSLTGWNGIRSYVLPVLTLALGAIAGRTRSTRTLMLEIINDDYSLTAKAKGLTENQITYRHQLKNAIIPMIPTMGLEIAGLLMGSFVVETIFAIPGMGRYFVQSIENLDYTLALGLVVFMGVLVVSLNFIFDIIYVFIDPRIRID